jgi:hypothetical protein
VRHTGDALAIPIVIAMLLIPVLVVSRNERLIAGEALVVAGIVVVALVSIAIQLRPIGPSAVDEALEEDDAGPGRPVDLARIERQLSLPAVRRNELDDRVRPVLRRAALRRLRERRGIDARAAPVAARAALDPELALLLEPASQEREPLGTDDIIRVTDLLEGI